MANNVPLRDPGRSPPTSVIVTSSKQEQRRASWEEISRTTASGKRLRVVDSTGDRHELGPDGDAYNEENNPDPTCNARPSPPSELALQQPAVTDHNPQQSAAPSTVASPQDLTASEPASNGQSAAATSTPDRTDHISSSDSTQGRARRTKSRDAAAKTPVLVPLSERDSIFATHYLPADALSSPRSDSHDVELGSLEDAKALPAMAVSAGVPFARDASVIALPPASIAANGHHDLSQTLKEGNVISGTVDLVPYKHQAGGHAHLYHFSGKAICKALSNRENEFYEIVEQTRPQLLGFLPRYIGVINVTLRTPAVGNGIAYPLRNGSFANASDGTHGLMSEERLTNGSHMVDHSQQTAPIPQVIIANNRHIIDDALLGYNSKMDKSYWTSDDSVETHASESDGIDLNASPRSVQSSPSRPKMPSSTHSSWGATTVNTKLKEQVLREVFGRRQTHLSTYENSRGFSRSLPKHGSTTSVPHRRGSEDLSSIRDELVKRPSLSPHSDTNERSLSASEAVHTRSGQLSRTASGLTDRNMLPLGTEKAVPSEVNLSSNLTMQLNKLSQRPAILISQEDEAYHADHEDESHKESADMATQTDIPPKTFSVTSPISKNQILTMEEVFPALPAASINDSPLPYHHPLNPDEAQSESQTSSQDKVEHFLLLENLTAGMKRPCVLDLKMGTRQYGIWASDKKRRSQRKKCKMATSVELGVRVNGMRVWNVKTQRYIYEDKYYGRDLKPGREFQETLRKFLYDGLSDNSVLSHIPVILEKLNRLEVMIKELRGYRFYGSSLLLIYDGASVSKQGTDSSSSDTDMAHAIKAASLGLKKSRIDIKIVDFANCLTSHHKIPNDAPFPPKNRDGIDRGYLRGLRSLRMYFQRIWRDINHVEWIDRGEGEGISRLERTGRMSNEVLGATGEDDDDVSI